MTRLTWQAVGLLAVLGGVAVALAAVTDWGSAEILALIGILGGIGTGAAVGGVVAGGVAQRVDQVHAATAAQTPMLETIVHQTNGMSEAQLDEVADRAAVKMIEAWRRGELR